jgi:hypothetical protein
MGINNSKASVLLDAAGRIVPPQKIPAGEWIRDDLFLSYS